MAYKIFLLVFIANLLLISGIFSSIHAQTAESNGTISNQSSLSGLTSTKKSYGLRISSPITGDIVLINGSHYFNKNGKEFSVQGFSVFDTNSSLKCSVSIIANGVKPYQTTNGTGPKGNEDYTTWKYTFTPQYSPLKEGSNKITSKLSCEPGNLVSYYSVNVTGSVSNGTSKDQIPTSQITNNKSLYNNTNLSKSFSNMTSSFTSNSNLGLNNQSLLTSNIPINATTILSPSTPSLLNSSSSSPTTINQSDKLQTSLKSMNIAIEKIENGKSQSLLFTVKDILSDRPVEGAFLSGKINDESFSGIANSNGEFTKALSSTVLKSPNNIEVTATATADGYKSNKISTSFVSSSTSKSTASNSDNTDNGAKDMASKIAKDVQKQLSKQGINIPLPFGS